MLILGLWTKSLGAGVAKHLVVVVLAARRLEGNELVSYAGN